MNVAIRSRNILSLCAGVGGLELGILLALRHRGEDGRGICYVEGEAAAAASLVASMEAGWFHWTVQALIKAGNALCVMAETSGGTAGSDSALCSAIAQWTSVRRIVLLEGQDPEIGAGMPDHPLRYPTASILIKLGQSDVDAERRYETAWLIERDDLATCESYNRVCLHYYAEHRPGHHFWTPDHQRAKRFDSEEVARSEMNGDPLLRMVEHMWVAAP